MGMISLGNKAQPLSGFPFVVSNLGLTFSQHKEKGKVDIDFASILFPLSKYLPTFFFFLFPFPTNSKRNSALSWRHPVYQRASTSPLMTTVVWHTSSLLLTANSGLLSFPPPWNPLLWSLCHQTVSVIPPDVFADPWLTCPHYLKISVPGSLPFSPMLWLHAQFWIILIFMKRTFLITWPFIY